MPPSHDEAYLHIVEHVAHGDQGSGVRSHFDHAHLGCWGSTTAGQHTEDRADRLRAVIEVTSRSSEKVYEANNAYFYILGTTSARRSHAVTEPRGLM
ncbi:hypothetical protein RR46_06502 [Papilio xuthus]|uniref:Uncharacterized protein n=1 Tax=Papilio xuthus TaxID=66420 RepID=A0A194QIR7_PAPXU|nr:hypothetical protein RR46_06502 [Papilio xuthus]